MSETGTKHDSGKPELFYNPPELQRGAARAYAYGGAKYGNWNWMGGIKYSRLYSAVLRHLLSWFWEGVPDDETGLSHLDHAAASLGMLMDTVKRRPDLDDRPCAPKEKAPEVLGGTNARQLVLPIGEAESYGQANGMCGTDTRQPCPELGQPLADNLPRSRSSSYSR